MKLTNSYCEGIEKSLTHRQYTCNICGRWTVWVNKKTGDTNKDCTCLAADSKRGEE